MDIFRQLGGKETQKTKFTQFCWRPCNQYDKILTSLGKQYIGFGRPKYCLVQDQVVACTTIFMSTKVKGFVELMLPEGCDLSRFDLMDDPY